MTTAPFREILILGEGRSGSNLLSSVLRNLHGNARFFEVFSPDAVEGMQDFPVVQANLSRHYGIDVTGQTDAALLAARDRDPAAFFDRLSVACRAAGHTSFSCKVFASQMATDDLALVLARPGIGVILLTRSRIGRYISEVKGRITGRYVALDTTDLRPDLRLEDFLDNAFVLDQALDAMRDTVAASGVPTALLHYERDLDVHAPLRLERVGHALRAIGIDPVFTATEPESWMVKQDHGAFWADRIGNGFEFAAALAGLGLADYATDAPMMDHVPTAQSLPPVAPAAVAIPSRRDALLAEGGYNHAYCADPVITFTAVQYDRSYFAEWMIGPEPAFGSRRGMHFLKPTWTMEQSDLTELRHSVLMAEACNPGHAFAFLHVSEREEQRYRSLGLRSVPGNPNLFTDETLLEADAPPHPDVPESDAIYIARLEAWKRHDLSRDLTAPLFVYGKPETPEAEAHMALLRQTCASAQFVNHMLGQGSYRYVQRADLARIMARARVSLALSAVEGVMRACTECLLAGLPVVSVPSIGGRDAFFTAERHRSSNPRPKPCAPGCKRWSPAA